MKKILLLAFILAISSSNIFAQWEPCNNGKPPVCEVFPLIADSNIIYAGFECGIYMTLTNGEYWIPINTKSDAYSFAISGNNIFAGTYSSGILLSTDKGGIWVYKNNGLPTSKPPNVRGGVNTILISGNNIFAGTEQGVFISSDNGDNWIAKNNGLPPPETGDSILQISSIIQKGSNIFAGTRNGVYMTTDNGVNWNAKNNGLSNLDIWALAVKDNNIFVATDSTIYLSTDNGDSWIPKISGDSVLWVNTIFIYNNYIFAGTYNEGVLFSTDNGDNWTEKNSGFGEDNAGIYSFAINGNYIFAADVFEGIFRAKLSDIITDVKETNKNNETIIYPNPASSSVRLKYESPNYSKLQISIFDMLGNEVFNTSEECNIGMNEKVIDCQSLETGYYIIRLKQGERVEAKPFLLITN